MLRDLRQSAPSRPRQTTAHKRDLLRYVYLNHLETLNNALSRETREVADLRSSLKKTIIQLRAEKEKLAAIQVL